MSWKTILLTRKIFMYLPTEERALVIKGFMTRGPQWQLAVKSSSPRNIQQQKQSCSADINQSESECCEPTFENNSQIIPQFELHQKGKGL